jgi:hypothetical protein
MLAVSRLSFTFLKQHTITISIICQECEYIYILTWIDSNKKLYDDSTGFDLYIYTNCYILPHLELEYSYMYVFYV